MSDNNNNNNFENDNTVVEVSGIDAGKLIERPIKPGYVFHIGLLSNLEANIL